MRMTSSRSTNAYWPGGAGSETNRGTLEGMWTTARPARGSGDRAVGWRDATRQSARFAR